MNYRNMSMQCHTQTLKKKYFMMAGLSCPKFRNREACFRVFYFGKQDTFMKSKSVAIATSRFLDPSVACHKIVPRCDSNFVHSFHTGESNKQHKSAIRYSDNLSSADKGTAKLYNRINIEFTYGTYSQF